MHDLVIRGGTIVDGTGQPAFVGDIAIDGDRITAVGEVAAKGRTEIDATGLHVAPGFVDIHTHYDGQATWDSDPTYKDAGLLTSFGRGLIDAQLRNAGLPS